MHTKQTYKNAREKPAVVYWIHYPEQNDPFFHGYIGITTNLPKRLSYHKRYSKHVFNRLLKGAIIDVLHECRNLDEAATKEKQYRPEPLIGWNLNKGGDIPPSQKNKTYEKQRLKGEERTEKQKLASKQHSEKMRGRIPYNKGICSKILINGIVYNSAYEAQQKLNWYLGKVYRIGKKV